MKRKIESPPPKPNSAKHFIRTLSFQAVSFFDESLKRQVVILYSLGEDGIIREYTNGQWTSFAINE